MIYLDAAATTLQKPPQVHAAVLEAMRTAASPGRGGHKAAMRAAEIAFSCREDLAALFHAENPEQVVFTFNATHGLNLAIHSVIRAGDPVVISGYEHNSVLRPLYALGADIRIARAPLFDRAAVLESFQRLIPGASAVICTHVSNVFGFILPVEEIASLCKSARIPFILDASQSAGILDLDFTALGADFAAIPGHKGLLGPQGTGVLLCGDRPVRPLLYGGTGSASMSPKMPQTLPDILEAGTHNIPGIAGLQAGVRFVCRHGPGAIAAHETHLRTLLAEKCRRIPGLEIFEGPNQAGVLSVRSGRRSCEALGEALAARGIAVRTGLHCAPCAHESAGTLDTGTVRFSFSPMNTESEVVRTAYALQEIQKIS